MRERVGAILAELEAAPPPVDGADPAEAAEFLRWIDQDHFIYLGYREYDLRTEGGQDLAVAVEGSGKTPALPAALPARCLARANVAAPRRCLD
jgi:glutamate dehydrogenase